MIYLKVIDHTKSPYDWKTILICNDFDTAERLVTGNTLTGRYVWNTLTTPTSTHKSDPSK